MSLVRWPNPGARGATVTQPQVYGPPLDWVLFLPYDNGGDPPMWSLYAPDPCRWRVHDDTVEVTGQVELTNRGIMIGYGVDVIYPNVDIPGPPEPVPYTGAQHHYPTRVWDPIALTWWDSPSSQWTFNSNSFQVVDHAFDDYPGSAEDGLRIDFGGISWSIAVGSSTVKQLAALGVG